MCNHSLNEGGMRLLTTVACGAALNWRIPCGDHDSFRNRRETSHDTGKGSRVRHADRFRDGSRQDGVQRQHVLLLLVAMRSTVRERSRALHRRECVVDSHIGQGSARASRAALHQVRRDRITQVWRGRQRRRRVRAVARDARRPRIRRALIGASSFLSNRKCPVRGQTPASLEAILAARKITMRAPLATAGNETNSPAFMK